MRILFVMHYPGYLRYYDSTVRELAARGHSVDIAFEKYSKQTEGLEALSGAPPGITIRGQLKGRRDSWEPIAMELRRVTDYLRYLHPDFAGAHYLRRRMESTLRGPFKLLTRLPAQPQARIDRLLRVLLALEQAIPASAALDAWVRKSKPDVVVVTPLVTDASRETDVVKAARARRIPTALAVASWDHLTTKGMIRERVDRVIVWNDKQRREAERLHFVDSGRIDVTGAQPFDKWFGREPSVSRSEFCRHVGLPPDRPFVLFVGSTASISEPRAETRFVREWALTLRASPALRDLAVLMRPHPFNSELWRDEDTSDITDFIVHPRDGANPVDAHDRDVYFDSLAHSVAVVGINTSAMIEAAILRRPVLTIRSEAFSATQSGTLHFGYLTPEQGGFVRVAASLEEHAGQLADTLTDADGSGAQIDRFVEHFLRPHGIGVAATPLVADAIEHTAALTVPPQPSLSLRRSVALAALWVSGAAAIYTQPRRLLPALRRVGSVLKAR